MAYNPYQNVPAEAVEELMNTLRQSMTLIGSTSVETHDRLWRIMQKIDSYKPDPYHVASFRENTITTIIEVDGFRYPYYILKPIIRWLDSRYAQDNYVHLDDLEVFEDVSTIAVILAELEKMAVIEPKDEDRISFKQGPRFVEFCVDCAFEIEQTHS